MQTTRILAKDLKVGDIIVVGSIDEYNEKVMEVKRKGNSIYLFVNYKTWGNVYKFAQPRKKKVTDSIEIVAR